MHRGRCTYSYSQTFFKSACLTQTNRSCAQYYQINDMQETRPCAFGKISCAQYYEINDVQDDCVRASGKDVVLHYIRKTLTHLCIFCLQEIQIQIQIGLFKVDRDWCMLAAWSLTHDSLYRFSFQAQVAKLVLLEELSSCSILYLLNLYVLSRFLHARLLNCVFFKIFLYESCFIKSY